MSFSRTCFFKKEILNEEVYYTFNFPLIDFAKKIGFSKDRYTHYQRRKLVDFFQQLQGLPPLITWFSDQEFRSTLIFPIVRIQNITSQHTKLIEPRFTLLMKTNKIKEVDKLTSNLLVKAKSIFYTEIP